MSNYPFGILFGLALVCDLQVVDKFHFRNVRPYRRRTIGGRYARDSPHGLGDRPATSSLESNVKSTIHLQPKLEQAYHNILCFQKTERFQLYLACLTFLKSSLILKKGVNPL